MGILNLTGFETGDLSEVGTFATVAIQSSIVRTGSYAARFTAIGRVELYAVSAIGANASIGRTDSTYYCGHLYIEEMPADTATVLRVAAATTANIAEVQVSPTGQVTLVGSTTSTVATTLATGQWYRLEVAVTSGGTSYLRVDGANEVSCTAVAGTQASLYVGRIAGSSGTFVVDDLAIRDDDWVGRGQVNILKPTGPGLTGEWTGDYTSVDEVPHNGDTDYVTSSTSGQTESVAMENATAAGVAGNIGAVKACAIVRDTGGTSNLFVRLRSGATNSDSSSGDPGSSYVLRAKLSTVDPADSAPWTTGKLDGIEVGVGITASAAVLCTALYAMVWNAGNTAPTITSAPAVTYAHGTATHQYSSPFEVAFTAEDTENQSADALNWQIRTGANRTGTLVASGTCTHAAPETASIAYNAPALVDGSQTLYLSVDDGVATSSDASFSVLRRIGIRKDVTLQWRQGGRVTKTIELQWRQGGRISREWALQWRVAPSDARIARALVTSPVVRTFRFERRDMNNQFLADVTPAIVSASGDLNNDRAIRRTARFTIDPTAATIDPLSDHIAVFEDLLVDGSYWQEFQWGLFALTAPQYRHTPALTTWEVGGNDLAIHLMEATTTETYVVAAGTNYMAAVATILDAHGIRHALPSSSATLPADKIFEVGTPWLTVINELLKAINYLTLYIDRYGVATTRYSDSLATRTPDVTYSGANLMVLDELAQEDDLTRFANQIIAVVTDANRAPLSSVATNADPNSPISTVRLGRTITKRIESSAVDQETLDAQVQRALEDAASMYQRMEVLTPLDPRREAHEVYAIDVDGIYEDSTWWARNWSVDFRPGATMKHALGRVQRIAS